MGGGSEPRSEALGRDMEGARRSGALLSSHLTAAGADGQEEAFAAAWRVREANFPARIEWFTPGQTLPVSLTGGECELGCDHCNGHYLRHMAGLAESLAGSSPRSRRATSYLVSGGCVAATGQVPYPAQLDDLRQLKRRGRLNFHVGLVGEAEIAPLADLADAVSFDVVGDDATIREILHLDRTVADYRRTLAALAARVRVVPHVLVGLHGGQLRGERRAVEIIGELGLREMVYIILIPTPGTALADVAPPAPAAVAELFAWTRRELPAARLGLGCMRPAGAYRRLVDPLAVLAGFQAIVQPDRAAVALAAELGLAAAVKEECCVL